MYKVVKRGGRCVDFDIRFLSQAIAKIAEAERAAAEEAAQISDLLLEAAEAELYEQDEKLLYEVRQRQCKLRNEHKTCVMRLNALLHRTWLQRNTYTGRSRCAAVSDKLLLTIPTPPTAVAADCSLQRGGVMCAILG